MASLDPITGYLGKKNAAHLLERATFGPSRSDIDNFSEKNADEALAILCIEDPLPDPPVDPVTGEPWVNPKPGPANDNRQCRYSCPGKDSEHKPGRNKHFSG
jgi:hypothetical protein